MQNGAFSLVISDFRTSLKVPQYYNLIPSLHHCTFLRVVHKESSVYVMTQASWTLGSVIITQNDTSGALTSMC